MLAFCLLNLLLLWCAPSVCTRPLLVAVFVSCCGCFCEQLVQGLGMCSCVRVVLLVQIFELRAVSAGCRPHARSRHTLWSMLFDGPALVLVHACSADVAIVVFLFCVFLSCSSICGLSLLTGSSCVSKRFPPRVDAFQSSSFFAGLSQQPKSGCHEAVRPACQSTQKS